MSKLDEYHAKKFQGSIEQARLIRAECEAALEHLRTIEALFSEMGRIEQHRELRRGLSDAFIDICSYGLQPIDAKFPELKAD